MNLSIISSRRKFRTICYVLFIVYCISVYRFIHSETEQSHQMEYIGSNVNYVVNNYNMSIINRVACGNGKPKDTNVTVKPLAKEQIELMDETSILFHIHQYLHLPEASCSKAVDVGGTPDCKNCKTCKEDGYKPVCFDEPFRPSINNCVVVSIGIGLDTTFDRAMATYGCKVISVDFTVANWTHHTYGPNLHFASIGLGASDKENRVMSLVSNVNTTLPNRIVSMFSLRTLFEIFDLIDKPIDYLKLDIENQEWEVLEQILSTDSSILKQVRQLSIEIHLESFLDMGKNDANIFAKIERILTVLNGLRLIGFKLQRWVHNEVTLFSFQYRGFSFSIYQEVLYLNSNLL